MQQIRLANVTLDYPAPAGGSPVRALERVNLSVHDGEFVSLVGPSGCGKSTILRLIAGLLLPTSGTVQLDGAPVQGVPPSVGFMFQHDALLPWATARENVEVALELKRIPRAERRPRADQLLSVVGLAGFEDAYPATLSGGMRKRVSLARVLAYDPAVYLMDEPFGALDAQTKVQLGAELLRIWDDLDRTVLFVTHDIEEAIGLSDRVLVMSRRPGHIKSEYRIDLPRPRDFYEVRFSARFQELHRAIWQDLASEAQPVALPAADPESEPALAGAGAQVAAVQVTGAQEDRR